MLNAARYEFTRNSVSRVRTPIDTHHDRRETSWPENKIGVRHENQAIEAIQKAVMTRILGSAGDLGQHVADDRAMDIGQTALDAVVIVRELRVIDP